MHCLAAAVALLYAAAAAEYNSVSPKIESSIIAFFVCQDSP
jgi:hypothetical protein